MRKVLLIALILCSANVWGQEKELPKDTIHNFTVTNAGVIWQKIYETEKSQAKILEYFKSAGFMELDKENESTLYLSIDRYSLNPKKNYSWGVIPMYLTEPMSAKVIIDIKNNRYRVTLSNISFASSLNLSMYGVSTNSNTQITLNDLAFNYRQNKYKSKFKNTNAEITNTVYTDLFTIHKNANIDTNDDW